MVEGKFERRQTFRGRTKPGRRLPIRYRDTGSQDWIEAETRNIGVGGAFVASDKPLAVGTPLVVEITPGGKRFELTAIVRWVGAHGQGSGMGLQFVRIDVDVLLELNEFLTGAQ